MSLWTNVGGVNKLAANSIHLKHFPLREIKRISSLCYSSIGMVHFSTVAMDHSECFELHGVSIRNHSHKRPLATVLLTARCRESYLGMDQQALEEP